MSEAEDADAAREGPVVFAEPGATWWPLVWGPAFAAVGIVVEWLTPGPVQPVMWLMVAGVLVVLAAVWVHGRRRVCSVRLTPNTLRLGRETVPVRRIVAVSDVGTPTGARVLGGGWIPPRGKESVPVRLDSGEVVLAWAAAPQGLRDALVRLVEDGVE